MLDHERRKNYRVPLVVAVKQLKDKEILLCQSCDLSTLGMALVLPRDSGLPADTPTKLEFALPGSNRTMALEAVTVRQKTNGRFITAGVVFQNLRPETRRRIRKFIEQRAA